MGVSHFITSKKAVLKIEKSALSELLKRVTVIITRLRGAAQLHLELSLLCHHHGAMPRRAAPASS